MTDGCVHLLYNSSWKFHQLGAGQLLSGQPVRYGKGRRYGLSITYKITSAGPLSSSKQGRLLCWACHLTFGLIGYITDSLPSPPTHSPPSHTVSFFFSMHHSDSFGSFLHSHCALPYSVTVPWRHLKLSFFLLKVLLQSKQHCKGSKFC